MLPVNTHTRARLQDILPPPRFSSSSSCSRYFRARLRDFHSRVTLGFLRRCQVESFVPGLRRPGEVLPSENYPDEIDDDHRVPLFFTFKWKGSHSPIVRIENRWRRTRSKQKCQEVSLELWERRGGRISVGSSEIMFSARVVACGTGRFTSEDYIP